MGLELKNFKVLYAFFILSAIILIGSGQFIVHHQINQQQERLTAIIRISNQIILNQDIVRSVSALKSNPNLLKENPAFFDQLINNWERNYHYLNDSVFQSDYTNQTYINIDFGKTKLHFEVIQKSLRKIISDLENDETLVASILFHEEAFNEKMQPLVYEYTKLADKNSTSLRSIEYLFSVIILFVLILEIIFLFRPAIQNLKLNKDKAKRASQLKGQFLSNMTHEIRTPLNGVIGIVRILLEENPKAHQIPHLKNLKFSADTLMLLINDILDFSKIEADKIELEETDFDLKEVLDGIEQSALYKAEEKKINIKVVFDKAIPRNLIGDSIRIRQILNNLVSNSIKFTDSGGVTMKTATEWQNDEYICINFSIEDTGIGIASDKISAVFESFSQANSDTTRKYGGTGLGLAIVKNLLELMSSKIFVKSEINKGSVFYFSLTLRKSKERYEIQKNVPASYQELKECNIHILLVEDNDINRVIANKLLHQWGIKVDNAENGRVALEMVKVKWYDVILMDLQMPEMDGYETTLAIRSMEKKYAKKVPIIALTAMATTDTKKKVLAHGMTDFATKPFHSEELYQKIFVNLDAGKKKEKISASSIESILNDLTEGDLTFKKQLSGLYISSFLELKEGYRTIITQLEQEKLSFIIHKNYTTLTLLKLEELSVELQRGKALISMNEVNEKMLKESADRVESICEEILTELRSVNEVDIDNRKH